MSSFLTPLPTLRAGARLRDTSDHRPNRPAHIEGLLADAVERATEPVLHEVRRLRRHLDSLREQRATQLPKYLTAEQAADIAGVSPATVRAWARRGTLQGHRAGRLLRVRLDQLEEYLSRDRDDAGDESLDDARIKKILAAER
jgi:excisionase family DNA binding protein